MYSVHQHWDPLKVCLVGKSYPPKFYDYIKNKKVRKVFYQIAEETEEDYQKLIEKLVSFGVKIYRPSIEEDSSVYFNGTSFHPPPMQPRDYTAMIGSIWYTKSSNSLQQHWDRLKGSDWPLSVPKNTNEFNDF